MQIKLKNLKIINFKGIQNFEADLNHITNVFGENGTGKTTIMDAFLWLFFGKNSEGAAQFEIKRLDERNQFIKDLETEVSALIHVNNQEILVKKVLRQKWVKRRGDIDSNYAGDENIYFWNDVPCKESEFKAKIKELIDENLFRLITDPFYFNTLKWQDRRNILIEIAGDITNDQIFDTLITASNKSQYSALINALNQKKTIDEFKREIAVKKKNIKDEAESIPSRIDEVRRGMPETLDFDFIRKTIHAFNETLQAIQLTLNDEVAMQQHENKRRADVIKNHHAQVQSRQQKIFGIKTKLQNIEFEVKQEVKEESGKHTAEINSINRQIADKKADLSRYATSISNLEDQLLQKQALLGKLGEEYVSASSVELKFSDNEFVCPSCKQPLPVDNIAAKKEELTANFNRDKIARVSEIENRGHQVAEEKKALEDRIANGHKVLADLNTELGVLETKANELQQLLTADKPSIDLQVFNALSRHTEYQALKTELAETEAIQLEEPTFPPLPVNDELKDKQAYINNEISDLQKKLAAEEQIKKAETRIAELEVQESKLAQELASLEGIEYSILQFTKAKVDAIERRINGKFKYVTFKMFATQVNGGETECCDALIKGVPFSNANNAARINAGIDIINTLCNHYEVYAPIFIDNRESVTRLIESESQIVNLIVSEADKKLRVA